MQIREVIKKKDQRKNQTSIEEGRKGGAKGGVYFHDVGIGASTNCERSTT